MQATNQPTSYPSFRKFLQELSFGKGALAIFALALLLRLAVCGELSHSPAVVSPSDVTDMATYKTLALSILHGHWPEIFDYQPFYYTVFLPLAYFFSPDGGVWPVLILQSILGACTCLLTAAAAARLFGKKAGWCAGFLLALSRFHIFYTAFLLLEVCFAFWTALVLYSAVRLLEKPQLSWKWAALLGFACAGALLTRGNALLWLPGVLALMLWRGRKAWRTTLLALAAFVLAFILPIVPYSIHNTRATGHFCGASVAGGKVLSLGNSPEAPAGGLEYPRIYYAWNADEEAGRQKVSSHILQWMRQEPLAFLELEARSLLLFWDHVEIPNNVSIDVNGKESRLLNLPLLFPWAILGALAFAGALLTWRTRCPQRLTALWLLLAVWGATSAFYLLARFRIGALPLICLFAAAALQQLWQRFQHNRIQHTPQSKNRLVLAIAAMLLGTYVVNFAHDTYCDYAMPNLFRALRPSGLALDLPAEKVVYDHGPLNFGGTIFSAVPPEGITIDKSFQIPEAFRSETPRHQTILLRVSPPGVTSSLSCASLLINGIGVNAVPTWFNDRSALWIRFDITAPVTANPTYTICLESMPALKEWGFALDFQRDYHRTTLDGETIPAEAVMELVLPTE